jgi:adenine-specific DNA-methyltransferase
MLSALLGSDQLFDFPKSVYAVRDTLAALTRHRKNATILDFFAGSGTTLHAAVMLNAEDGGSRRSIIVTNNEVSAAEAEVMRSQGLVPGDPKWEQLGIFNHVTRPRVEAALTGRRPDGSEIVGTYADGSTLSDGFAENVEFFELTYEDPDLVNLGRKFQAVAPLLWMKAGGQGDRIEKPVAGWTLPDGAIYGILFNIDQWREFIDAIVARGDEIKHAFIVTDADAAYQQILTELPTNVGRTQLYGDYLHTFEINTKGRA